ncbi:MAG: Verru_Chthon cassette protein A [Methylacidiphilales bacterium]|nr:Verru_Chthon cassette protein A [Candidatus Methylacidiphilales bacterium]
MKHSPFRSSSGFALILTLAALAVMMILLLALFHGASHQLRGAESDANYAREKILADSAVALVIGQIQQATSVPNQAWISQPGLLRTYDTTASRQPTASYKLYSLPTLAGMTDKTGNLNFLTTDIPSDWNSAANQSLYTDLNTPAETTSGKTVYPILDPAAAGNIPGINIDSGHHAEMPVAWLYQLRDGTLGPAGNGTATNPIVARIAFWTDDETSKININTAGVGSPWNTPCANTADNATFSTHQPAAGEFSSYPGHPAMTSLGIVLGSNPMALSPGQIFNLTPRYVYGGSQLGTQTTTPGEIVPPKNDRLYPSLDELCFSSTLTDSARQPNPITPDQLNVARFALTAHSEAPETTLLGEPRVAIWPVSDAPTDSTHTTATDRAIESATTVGNRSYFFQRHDPLNPLDNFDPNGTSAANASNRQLFSDLLARGNVAQPGYGAMTFSQKYSGATWMQLMLEIADFIRGLNAVDPSPSPFIPFAGGNSSNAGRGFVIPLTTTYPGSSGTTTTLRGLGRCPTLSSLTFVLYVSGIEFNNSSKDVIDFDTTPDTDGSIWTKNFDPTQKTNRWSQATGELVRAFVVPCTFQPGCAYPEVSDDCDIQISGLDGISVGNSNDFGFPTTPSPPPHSRLLSDVLQVTPADRAWGGNEGPLAWRASALDANSPSPAYPFAGTKPFLVPFLSLPQIDPATHHLTWPSMSPISFSGIKGLTVLIRDHNGNAIQTLQVDLPPFTLLPPTILGECTYADDLATTVAPSYYMNLNNRLRNTHQGRAFMIQAGDICQSVEAATDLRVIAGLSSVPSSLFRPHPGYGQTVLNYAGGSYAQNIRFPDETSACFATGLTTSPKTLRNAFYGKTALAANVAYPTVFTPLVTVTDWSDGATPVPYDIFSSSSCSVPTGTNGVTMSPGLNGDWDTGPGLEPDGAQINLPDAGTTLGPATAYFSLTGGQVGATTQRMPNALVPSPVIFGSLPAGIDPLNPANSEPWRTLLFCPYPAANNSPTPYAVHPGTTSPPDYLLLDNFWMPVVEPYAISTTMATSGKINLNDQIAPFTWIHRSTGLHALLNDLRIPAIPASLASQYKSSGAPTAVWNAVDEDATIAQIENRFATGDAYLTESEICAVPLVPKINPPLDTSTVSAAQSALDAFWNGSQSAGRLTGDNLRELPYAQLYGRLTTRSNSYTVHVHVQVLKKLTSDPHQDTWDESTDIVLGDWRGSYEIERYLDPSAPAPTPGQPLGPYKFRIVSARRFAP